MGPDPTAHCRRQARVNIDQHKEIKNGRLRAGATTLAAAPSLRYDTSMKEETASSDNVSVAETGTKLPRAEVEAAHHVAQVLRDRIVSGVLPPGARIVERRLCAELDVSRTPVREALKILRADGLIETSLHRGAQVTAFTASDTRNLFDTIAALESRAALRVAERDDPALTARLETLHAEMLRHYENAVLDAYFLANSAIHDAIVAGCGNPELQAVHDRLMVRARRGRYLAILDPDRWAEAVVEHEALMAALRARDPAAVAAIWDRHLRRTGDWLAARLDAAEDRSTDQSLR